MREKCPACGDHQGESDFDPDCGKFYTCAACGHRWSYADENREEVVTDAQRVSFADHGNGFNEMSAVHLEHFTRIEFGTIIMEACKSPSGRSLIARAVNDHVPSSRRITVNKKSHRIRFENESEDSVDVVIEPLPPAGA